MSTPRIPNFQPEKYQASRDSIGGITDAGFTAKRGQIVNYGTTGDTITLAADGRTGLFLTRDVIAASGLKTWHDANELRPFKAGFQTPFLGGQAAQAEDYDKVWVEGTDHLDTSLADVAVHTPVTTKSGKFSILTDSEAEEGIGKIISKRAAQNAETGYSYLIEINRTPLNIPAAG